MQKIPIGISDFKELIEEGYLYVDKTLLIQELLDKGTKVAWIPRMRRFGKTLNLSMLRYFFEKSDRDTSHLFKKLNIWKDEQARTLQGKFPVIFLSFKDIKHASWEETLSAFQGLLAREFQRHTLLLDDTVLNKEEQILFSTFVTKKTTLSELEASLLILTGWLERYHKQRVILLIDEYDAPAHAAYVHGYYEKLITFLRNFLSSGLKDNSSLERGVVTGILRIAKESIFSGLNNISTFTIQSERFRDKFGLLEHEVEALLERYGLSNQLSTIRKWYDGYQIGSLKGVYNPWSVLKCIEERGQIAPYWINTSDNALMKELITKGSESIKEDLEELLKGGCIEKTIEEGLAFPHLIGNEDAIWSLLLFSGYLTTSTSSLQSQKCYLSIPNLEVHSLYQSTVLSWFKTSLNEKHYRLMLISLAQGDIDTFSKLFQKFLISSLSVFDATSDQSEKVYHAFVLGMLVGLSDTHEVRSNRESGLGRYDVMLIPKNANELGLVLEFKKIDTFEPLELEEGLEKALKQITDKAYDQDLQDRGVKRILHVALVFKGKQVLIRSKPGFLIKKQP